jgi:hypothetical protein
VLYVYVLQRGACLFVDDAVLAVDGGVVILYVAAQPRHRSGASVCFAAAAVRLVQHTVLDPAGQVREDRAHADQARGGKVHAAFHNRPGEGGFGNCSVQTSAKAVLVSLRSSGSSGLYSQVGSFLMMSSESQKTLVRAHDAIRPLAVKCMSDRRFKGG